MNTKNNYRETDEAIRRSLPDALPQPPENMWFTKRVANRLPDRPPHLVAWIAQRFCYVLAAAVLVGSLWMVVDNLLTNGVSMASLIFLTFFPLIVLCCVGICVAPIVRRVMAGENSLIK